MRPSSPIDRLREAAISLAVFGLLLTSCNPFESSVDKIAGKLQDAIDAANQNSEAWRQVVLDLPGQLNALESQVNADAKQLLATTINDVNYLQQQVLETASSLAKDTVAFTLIQAQCTASYFKSSIVSYLQYLKAKVLGQKPALPAAKVCNFNPDRFDIDPATLAGSARTWTTNVYGYNFFPQAPPSVQVLNGSNQLVRTAKNQPVFTSLYQMQLQLEAADFAGLATGYRVGLAWPNGDKNFVAVNLTVPAQLSIVSVEFPSIVTVGSPVKPKLTVKNAGTVDSGQFTILWRPDASKPSVKSLSSAASGLSGNATGTFELSDFTYSQRDYFDYPTTTPITGLRTTIVVASPAGTAESSRTLTFTLTNLPFRSLPPIRISKPNVNQDWTDYTSTVDVRPGDIVTVTASGCVQTGGSGDTWKRYLNPIAPDEPGLYHGLIAITPLMEKHSGRVPSGTRIQDVNGRPIAIPLSQPAQRFYLGYEDTDYGNNGYDNHDNGTEDQCKGVGDAVVTIQIQRN